MADDQTIPAKVKGAAVTFTVKVDGQAIPQTTQVYAVVVIKEANRIPSAKLTIIDGEPSKTDFAVSSGTVFLPGKEIEIFAGHQSNEDSIFKGIIVKHGIVVRKGGVSQLMLECKDKSFRMALGRKSAYYVDQKDSDIADTLLGNHKLTITSIEDTKKKFPEMVQYDTSDWDFLVTRMDINGKLVLINNGAATIKAPDFSTKPVLTLQYGATIHEFDAEMDARNQYKAVKAISWDQSSQELLEINGQDPSKIKDNGNFTAAQLADVTGLKEMVLRHGGNISQEELQSWADSYWQKSRMAKIRGRASFDGFAGVKPGDIVELKGFGDRFNGKVLVAAIRHDLANGGWTTSVQFGMDPEWFASQFIPSCPAAKSLIPDIQGLHTGVVSQLEKDPAGEDRVLIKLPMVDPGGNGTWARVATLDAGKKRGSFFRPNIGDEVLIGFIDNDPRNAVIIGMMNSSKLPAAIQPKDSNKIKGFFFSSEMEIRFNDEDPSMTFQTKGGNKLIISEKSGAEGITLQDQHGNKILMNKDGITMESAKKMILKASSGDIEIEGMNLKQKAQAEFKAEGAAGLEVSSSAIAKLKGSLVQIN
ncbi:MAG TPA: type VI secretion system tip protein VgrG [Chitinophagaceae bacterium]|nr:type VI secretion system tip protein VgrG [Chitinophagaceae bacterium]